MRGRGFGEAAQLPQPQQSQGIRVIGPMLGYYSDLASGQLVPEKARIDALQFRCRIDAAGAIEFFTPALQVVSNYAFVVRRLYGFAMNPSALGNAPALIDFNLSEQGRASSVFKRPISYATLMGNAGPANVLEWDGAYMCLPGTQLEVQWTVDTARWAALVGASREVGIQIVGDLVIAPPQAG